MHELKIFRYALFPSGANYSDTDLKKRVADSKYEIKVLLGDSGKSTDYSIVYKYSNDEDSLWLVAVATEAIQRSFPLFSERETIIEFAQRIQERVSSLPIVLNSIALEIDAHRYSATPSKLDSKQLVSLLLKRSGKYQKIELNGKVQELLFPVCDPFKHESEPRLIKFKINSLSKYMAEIYEIEDPYFEIPGNLKMPLIFGADRFNSKAFLRLAHRVFPEDEVQLIVSARVKILDGRPVEYHFYSEVTGSNKMVRVQDS